VDWPAADHKRPRLRTDLSHRRPFKRLVGPLDFTMEHFETNSGPTKIPTCSPARRTPVKKISWNGFFYLDPLRSWVN